MHTFSSIHLPAHAYIIPRYRETLEMAALHFKSFSPLPYERKGRHAA